MARYTLAVGFYGPDALSPDRLLPVITSVLPAGWSVRFERLVKAPIRTGRIGPPASEDTGGFEEAYVLGAPSGANDTQVAAVINTPALIQGLRMATEILFSVVGPDPSIATPGCDRTACPQRFDLTRRLNSAADVIENQGFDLYSTGFRLRPPGEPETSYPALAAPARRNNTGLLLGAAALGLLFYFSRDAKGLG